MSTHEEKFYSTAEAQSAIEQLLPEEKIYLRKAANVKKFTHNISLTRDDLIHESVIRTLEGRRNWNKDLDIVSHLIGTIKSISNDNRRKNKNINEISEVDLSDNEKEKLTSKAASIDPSEIYESEENIKAIIAEVKADTLAFKILNLLFVEHNRKEIIGILNISQKQYDTKKKLITRKIKKLKDKEKCDEQ